MLFLTLFLAEIGLKIMIFTNVTVFCKTLVLQQKTLQHTFTWRRLHEPIQQQALLSWVGSLVVRQLIPQDQKVLRITIC